MFMLLLYSFLFHDALSHHKAHAPCRLKVESARNGVHVKHFSCKKQMRTDAALKRIHVH